MARDENPPFDRGHTYYDGETIDTNNLGGENLEGKEWVFEDVNPNTGVARTGRSVRCRIVRNASGINLLPKRIAQLDTTTAGNYPGTALGYVNTTAGEGFPIDEYLPSAGVPNGDLFWIVIDGPAVVTTAVEADLTNVIAIGGWVVGVTAAASTHVTTAGRVMRAATTGATNVLRQTIQNRIGRAMSAKTTANTNVDLLIDCGRW